MYICGCVGCVVVEVGRYVCGEMCIYGVVYLGVWDVVGLCSGGVIEL